MRQQPHKNFILFFLLLLAAQVYAQPVIPRLQRESEHFVVIYWKSHEYLVPHIIVNAERALKALMPIFHYTPTEKIVIFTNDYNDFGAAGTTSVPHNFIRLDIEPFELDYENLPFNERMQWLISHELVHVIVGDGVSSAESFTRSLFSKVPPEREQPLSVFYSLLTNFDRYSPDWHQEGIAMFIETWLNGGFGRIQGSFDEMFFRSMVYDGKPLASPKALDAKIGPTSFLLQMQYYLYGARFSAYLAQKYGSEKFLDWYREKPRYGYEWYFKKFRDVFGLRLEDAWKNFEDHERYFQHKNIARLFQKPLTPIRYISKEPLGWVTQPMLNSTGEQILFGAHGANHLSSLKSLNLRSNQIKTVCTLPTPRLVQVASTAIDPDAGLVFFTTNNNYLHRDLWLFDPLSKIKKRLFKDVRIGDLTACAATREIWGIHHAQGRGILAYSVFPYLEFKPVAQLGFGITIQHLAVSPSGRWIAATLHEPNGAQKIIIFDTEILKKTGRLDYIVVADNGSPEHPSWSQDESTLFWDAYVNGVANIFRYNIKTQKAEAISHTVRGLFRPIAVSPDSVFAFEFTTEGFVPVVIPNKPADFLPAIRYYGQEIIRQEPELAQWDLKNIKMDSIAISGKEKYSGLKNLKVHSLIPVVSAFMHQKSVGYYGHMADPLFVHDLKFEISVSPHPTNYLMPKFHLDVKYEYKKEWELRFQNNASNFYDLFNKRKRSTIQKKLILKNTHYWIYDFPQKLKQTNGLSVYYGAQAINDNMVRIYRPDFLVYQSILQSTNLRRSIGSSDVEQGTKWAITLMTFHVDPRHFQHVGGLHVEWEHYGTYLRPHNVWMFKFAAGLRHTKKDMAIGRFYFGGFGNRYLENESPMQYRKVFRFPGRRIYSLPGKHFVKFMLENKLPPVWFSSLYIGQHALIRSDLSIYSQTLILEPTWKGSWIDLGAQINFHFRHWFNLESDLSIGVAKAWNRYDSSWEWFISFKPFRT